jgi:parallel beta-helix repeat protein
LLLEPLEGRLLLDTYFVRNINNAGADSLRQAILNANANPGSNDIQFNIPGGPMHTIYLTSGLPDITNTLYIRGDSQPGYNGTPVIALDGSFAGPVQGLTIKASGCVVQALDISRFLGHGIALYPSGSYTSILDNYIGTDLTGTVAQGNGRHGVLIDNGAHDNTLSGNLISGNAWSGVAIVGHGSDSNVLKGNFIGTNAVGHINLPNGQNGVAIWGGASYNVVGLHVGSNTGNLISGNAGNGVAIYDPGTSYNVVQGNYIGVDNLGNFSLANIAGVWVGNGASFNTIGGTAPGVGNLISGNNSVGVMLRDAGTYYNVVQGNSIGTNFNGTAALGNSKGVWLTAGASRNTILGNLISGNQAEGVLLTVSGTTGNTVQNNSIGTNLDATSALGNLDGVSVALGASGNFIGGDGGRNLISGNQLYGVALWNVGTSFNVVQNNYIGTDGSGSNAVPNGQYGVLIGGGASYNTIGGTTAALGNLISGNGYSGVLITDSDTMRNTLWGNYIGTNATATAALPNGQAGVAIVVSAHHNVIGGSQPGMGNLIAGNSGAGMALNGAGTVANVVQGNSIGIPVGNGTGGVVVDGASNNLIGGNQAGAGNSIVGNSGPGVFVEGGAGNTVQANTISRNAAAGVGIVHRASRNHVWDNVIAANGDIGVQVGQGAGDAGVRYNDLRRNTISANVALGIDLAGDGVTPNHSGFLAGPNDFQNYPELAAASSDGTSTTVVGTLQSTPSTTFKLEFFGNTVLDPSGFGQGEQFLRASFSPDGSATVSPDGSATVTTNGSGKAPFTVVLDGTTPGQFLTATATDPLGNTSEFSAGVGITDAGAGAGGPGGAGAGAQNPLAAFQSVPSVVPPPGEHPLTKGPPPQADSVPFRNGRPDRAAVDYFFGGASLLSKGALRHQTAAALSKEDAFFLGEGMLASDVRG